MILKSINFKSLRFLTSLLMFKNNKNQCFTFNFINLKILLGSFHVYQLL